MVGRRRIITPEFLLLRFRKKAGKASGLYKVNLTLCVCLTGFDNTRFFRGTGKVLYRGKTNVGWTRKRTDSIPGFFPM